MNLIDTRNGQRIGFRGGDQRSTYHEHCTQRPLDYEFTDEVCIEAIADEQVFECIHCNEFFKGERLLPPTLPSIGDHFI